jgi:uncharacterized membrane protein
MGIFQGNFLQRLQNFRCGDSGEVVCHCLSMSTTDKPLACPACRVIDKADGVEDGNLYKLEHYQTRNERNLLDAVLQAQDRAADQVTSFAGSLTFVYIHSIWFAIWVLLNVGVLGASLQFDKFPFGLLTMIVSLEAIFLSTFVMVSQNRQSARADIRSELDFETNLRSEIWAVHIGQALGVDPIHVEDVVRTAIEGSRVQLNGATPAAPRSDAMDSAG